MITTFAFFITNIGLAIFYPSLFLLFSFVYMQISFPTNLLYFRLCSVSSFIFLLHSARGTSLRLDLNASSIDLSLSFRLLEALSI